MFLNTSWHNEFSPATLARPHLASTICLLAAPSLPWQHCWKYFEQTCSVFPIFDTRGTNPAAWSAYRHTCSRPASRHFSFFASSMLDTKRAGMESSPRSLVLDPSLNAFFFFAFEMHVTKLAARSPLRLLRQLTPAGRGGFCALGSKSGTSLRRCSAGYLWLPCLEASFLLQRLGLVTCACRCLLLRFVTSV